MSQGGSLIADTQNSGVTPPTDKPQLFRLKVQAFYETMPNGGDPEVVTTLLDAIETSKPFHFYGLTAQSKDKGYQIETMRFWNLITPATGARAQKLIDHTIPHSKRKKTPLCDHWRRYGSHRTVTRTLMNQAKRPFAPIS